MKSPGKGYYDLVLAEFHWRLQEFGPAMVPTGDGGGGGAGLGKLPPVNGVAFAFTSCDLRGISQIPHHSTF